jgi:hypothetical protein
MAESKIGVGSQLHVRPVTCAGRQGLNVGYAAFDVLIIDAVARSRKIEAVQATTSTDRPFGLVAKDVLGVMV